MNLRNLDTHETQQLLPERMRRLLAGKALTFEVEHYHQDGRIVPLEVSASWIMNGGETFLPRSSQPERCRIRQRPFRFKAAHKGWLNAVQEFRAAPPFFVSNHFARRPAAMAFQINSANTPGQK